MKKVAALVTVTVVLLAPPVQAEGISFDRHVRLVELFLIYLTGPRAGRPVNINEASSEEIARSLAGVDSRMAESLVSYREQNGEYDSLLDLLDVPGFSRSAIMANRQRILFSDP